MVENKVHYSCMGHQASLVASCIILMGYMGCFDDGCPGESCSVPSRLERAYGSLKLYCYLRKLQIRLRGFTLQNMHYGGAKAFPWLGCKGSDSMIVLKWVKFFAALKLQQHGWSKENEQTLQWILDGANAGISWGEGLFSHGLWLKRSCNRHLARAVQRFASCYCRLAKFCCQNEYSLYGMVPKLHALVHFRADLDDSIERNQVAALSPTCFDNSMSEDFIGKIAKQSRRISFRNVEHQLLLHYKTKLKFQINKFRKRHCL